MRILLSSTGGRPADSGGRPRKGPPERTFDEAVESILAKIEAIERHRKLMREAGGECDPEASPRPAGEGTSMDLATARRCLQG